MSTRRISVSLVSTLTILVGLFSTTSFGQEPAKLFEAVQLEALDLTPKQAKLLNDAREDRTRTGDVVVVKIEPQALNADTISLEVDQKQEKPYLFDRIKRESVAKGGMKWIGRLKDDKAEADQLRAEIFTRGDNTIGSFATEDGFFTITPLGGGLHAVSKRDLSKLPPDHPPEFDELQKQNPAENEPPPRNADAPVGGFETTVLVAYTQAVTDNWADMDFYVQSLVDRANASYQASDINLTLKLVHTAELQYQETGSLVLDVNRLKAKQDGYLDQVHSLRDQHAADVVMLLVERADYAGYSGAIMANANSAFAVVDDQYDYYYTFAHEIGHLQGARHNPEHDPGSPAYAHGYRYPGNPKWRTIMAYDCQGGCRRIGQWSNPNVKINGIPTGTAAKHDNARRLRETAATISSFR